MSFSVQRCTFIFAWGLGSLLSAGLANAQAQFQSIAPLYFTVPQGGSNPLPQVMTIANAGAPFTYFTPAGVTTSGGNWLSVTSCAGLTTPSSCTVGVDATGMTAGSYSGSITLQSNGSGNVKMTVPVTLTVEGPGAFFAGVPGGLTFVSGSGFSPSSQIIPITNGGVGALNWTASASAAGGNWLSVTPQNGAAPSSATVTVSPQGLAPGTYVGQVLLQAPTGNATIPVTLNVLAAGGSMFQQQTGLSFTMLQGGSNPLAQVLTVASTGSALRFFTPSVQTSSGGNWLEVTSCAGETTPSSCTIAVNAPTLGAGVYSGQVQLQLNAPGPNAVVIVPVTLTVEPPTSAFFGGAVGGAVFVAGNGYTPSPETVLILNGGVGPLNWTATATPPFSVSAGTGTAPSPLTISANAAGLAPGTYLGSVLLQSSTGSMTIPLSLVVQDANTSMFQQLPPISFTMPVGGPSPPFQTVSINSTGAPFAFFTPSAQTANGGAWLTNPPHCQGTSTPTTCKIIVSSATLPVGVYSGQLLFEMNRTGANAVAAVPVTMTVEAPGTVPELGITLSHTGDFALGQNATYTATVSNAAAGTTTSGTVTVTDAIPNGLTLVSMAGTGWTCTSNSCTRSDALAAGSSFPPITVTVNATANAGAGVVNTVTVSGGGSATATATDPTNIGASQGPPAVTGMTPAAGTTSVPLNSALTWTASAGATSYNVNFGTTNPPPMVTTTTGTTYTPPGGLATNTTYYWQVTAVNASGSTASPVVAFSTGATLGSGLQFIPVTPCRVMDTRGAVGPFGGPMLSAGGIRTVNIPQSACGIPTNAQAYSLNITVVPPAALTYLTVWPAGQTQPVVSTLNSFDGRIVANAAIVVAGTNGGINLFASDATNVIIDINGYFVPAGTPNALSFYTATPCRIVDTRSPNGAFGSPFMGAQSTRSFTIPNSSCNIPASAKAYSLNFTVVPHNTLSYLTTWPTGQTQPLVSTLNAYNGGIVANAAIVPAGTSGQISVFVTDDTELIIDVNGYFAPPGSSGALSLYTVTPCRIADTRGPAGPFGGPSMAGGSTRSFTPQQSSCQVPAAAQAYSLNVTAVPPAPLTYLTAWPMGQTQPVVSTLNSPNHQVVANAAIVPAGTGGGINLFVSNTTDVILDINAYFGQ